MKKKEEEEFLPLENEIGSISESRSQFSTIYFASLVLVIL